MMLRTWGTLTSILLATGILFSTSPTIALADQAEPPADCFKTTTELGVTITPDDLFDALDESCAFWPAVRKHLKGNDFKVADADVRATAERNIAVMQDRLHRRLMEGDDAAGSDVLQFAIWSLRKTRLYQELRATLGDPQLVQQLREAWSANCRNQLTEGAAPSAEELVAPMLSEIKTRGVPADRAAKTADLLGKIAVCTLRVRATDTSRMIREYDQSLGDTPAAMLTRDVVFAADWAGVIKPQGARLKKEHFLRAWEELHSPPLEVTASAVGGQ